jgi:hypothetical protein
MSHRTGACYVVAVLAAVLLAHPLAAQRVTCRPSPGSNEAELLTRYAVPLTFGAALPSGALRPGDVAIALETTWLPTPPSDVRRSGECYLDKAENTTLSPVLPRPRIAVGLPAGLTVEASLLPPVTVADATPFLAGLALSYARTMNASTTVQARVHGTLGYVDGPVTCSRDALQDDPTQPCFGDSPSSDRYAPNAMGAELLATRAFGTNWSAQLGVGAVHARPQFDVNFTNAFGVVDNTRIRFDDTRAAITAGVARRVHERAAVGVVGYIVPGRTSTVRLTGQWRLR